jgi:hypothetical protein
MIPATAPDSMTCADLDPMSLDEALSTFAVEGTATERRVARQILADIAALRSDRDDHRDEDEAEDPERWDGQN